MQLDLSIHDPDLGDPTLLECLAEAARGADRGGGIFAWANRSGADLFFGRPEVLGVLSAGPFELVVGIDSITDPPAIGRLTELDAAHPNLWVRVYCHDEQRLFHPKLAWFQAGESMTLLVGSGNLTSGGLQKNWEATATCRLDRADARATDRQLHEWIRRSRRNLRRLDDPEVLRRAELNTGRERDLRYLRRKRPRRPEPQSSDPQILVAEIGGGDRWKQGDFGRAVLEQYFGYVEGEEKWIDVTLLDNDGSVVMTKPVKLIKVASSNYRAELAGVSGSYPPGPERPIAVYLRRQEQDFEYVFLRPEDPGWVELNDFLTARGPWGRSRRRIVGAQSDLRLAWPDCPLLRNDDQA